MRVPELVLFTGIFGCGLAHASQVHFRPLEEVLQKATVVFDAEVVKATRSNTQTQMTMDWELRDLHAIRGPLPTAMKATYTEIIPVMLDNNGKVVGSFSPILESSGEEWNATKGRWIFLTLPGVTPPSLHVLRVEPLSQRDKIVSLVAAMPSASTAPAPPPAPSPSPSASTAAPASSPPPPVRSGRGCGCEVPRGNSTETAYGSALVACAIALLRVRVRRRGSQQSPH